MSKDKILVTKSFLPPKKEYEQMLDAIWESKHLTNSGPFHQELEKNLLEYLRVKNFVLVSNGTIAIQLALRALKIKGEIITTPFSYVATVNSILWEGCTPVFADIKSDTFCIDPLEIEKKITKNTKAILATHVFGIPCDVVSIEKIAEKHGLKVIYDAAHAFGVEYNGQSVLNYGDISTLSFHATKLFHTIEGGGIVFNNSQLTDELKLLRSFGHRGDEYICLGINAKMAEPNAAMGLLNLKYVDGLIEERKQLFKKYKDALKASDVKFPVIADNVMYNYAYFPILLDTEESQKRVKEALEHENIFPRRYFFPSLNTVPQVKYISCPVSEDIAKRILCLPFYNSISDEIIEEISVRVKKALKE